MLILSPSSILVSFLLLIHLSFFFHCISLCFEIDLRTVLLEPNDKVRHLVDILGDTFNEPSKVLLVVGKTRVVDLLVELHRVQLREAECLVVLPLLDGIGVDLIKYLLLVIED